MRKLTLALFFCTLHVFMDLFGSDCNLHSSADQSPKCLPDGTALDLQAPRALMWPQPQPQPQPHARREAKRSCQRRRDVLVRCREARSGQPVPVQGSRFLAGEKRVCGTRRFGEGVPGRWCCWLHKIGCTEFKAS